MSAKANVQWMYGYNQGALKRVINDITEEESLFRGKDNLTHIRWLTGHLVVSADQMLCSLGGESLLSEKWKTLFERGSGFSDDPSVYPSMADLRAALYEYQEKITARLESLTDEQLSTKLAADSSFEATAAQAMTFLCAHEFYHLGQIVTLARLQGREQPFG